ncbi:hypothetical protein [Noviherbaspirillum malthae]|uniref:hypothetical protein n=1 Tax=Noviherbaspirillum malthae TaxID=1260987 RepID=UPI00188F88AD|nr:hypothetical protein [Noviherbaspirillum malthae]
MESITVFLNRLGPIFWKALPALSLMSSIESFAGDLQKEASSLRVRVNNNMVLGEADLHRMTFKSDAAAMAAFRKNVIQIGQGGSVQLQVEIVEAQGKATDVTRSAKTKYASLSPWKLKVNPEGLVTIAPSEPYLSGQAGTMAGDTAVFISYETDTSAIWNKVFFSITH